MGLMTGLYHPSIYASSVHKKSVNKKYLVDYQCKNKDTRQQTSLGPESYSFILRKYDIVHE